MVQRTITIGRPDGPYYETKKQDGEDTPKSLRKPGLWPINRYNMETDGWMRNYAYLVNTVNGGRLSETMYDTGSFCQLSTGPVVWPSDTDVINKLGDKWRNSEVDLGMYLSPEGRESILMMITGLAKIANGAHALKRGDFGGFLRNLNELPRSARKRSARAFNQGDLSGSFLAAHLGWEPLIKDIYSASEGIADIPDKPYRVTARKLGSRQMNIVNKPNGATYVTTVKVQKRAILDISRTPTFAQRFGLDNPFRIAWELVPLSFVADYFLPIGSTIAAMGNISALYGQKGMWKALEQYEFDLFIPQGTKLLYAWYLDWVNDRDLFLRGYHRTYSRQKWTPSFTQPLKSLSVTLPTSVMKLSTMAALTHQRILSLAK